MRIMGKNNTDFSLVPSSNNTSKGVTKKGTYEEGVDGRGNPYRKQTDELTGISTKEEVLKKGKGKRKLTAYLPPEE